MKAAWGRGESQDLMQDRGARDCANQLLGIARVDIRVHFFDAWLAGAGKRDYQSLGIRPPEGCDESVFVFQRYAVTDDDEIVARILTRIACLFAKERRSDRMSCIGKDHFPRLEQGVVVRDGENTRHVSITLVHYWGLHSAKLAVPRKRWRGRRLAGLPIVF